MIVKPDVPLTPTDASYANMAHGTDTPQIAYTWSDFGALRTNYVFAFTQGTNALAKFSPADFGMNTPVYAYDYFAGTGQLVNPWDTIQKQISGDALYMVLAPVGPSGIAILGNANQFVTMGKKRVSGLADYGAARVSGELCGRRELGGDYGILAVCTDGAGDSRVDRAGDIRRHDSPVPGAGNAGDREDCHDSRGGGAVRKGCETDTGRNFRGAEWGGVGVQNKTAPDPA